MRPRLPGIQAAVLALLLAAVAGHAPARAQEADPAAETATAEDAAQAPEGARDDAAADPGGAAANGPSEAGAGARADEDAAGNDAAGKEAAGDDPARDDEGPLVVETAEEDSVLDDQTYEGEDDDFIPSEEIPVDEPIPFPSDI